MDLVVGALGIKAVIESASPEDHVVGAEFETEFKVADVFIQKDHLRVFCLCRDHFAGVGLAAALHSEMKIVIFPQENGNAVMDFLAQRPDFELEGFVNPLTGESVPEGMLQVLPGVEDCDSMFVARLRRRKE